MEYTLLNRRWILTEILLRLSSGAADEILCYFKYGYQPRKTTDASFGNNEPSLLQL
jgi:hypothetical protein